MKVTLKMMMPIVAPSWDYIRMANMTASAAPAPEAIVTPVLRGYYLILPPLKNYLLFG